MKKISECPFVKFDVCELLPQRPPFVMIDELYAADDVVIKTHFKVCPDNVLSCDGKLSEAGVIENMAQTCASRIGYISKINGLDVLVGYIGALKNVEFYRLPLVGETLDTEISVVADVLSMTLVNAVVKINNEIIASCEMKVAVAEKSN